MNAFSYKGLIVWQKAIVLLKLVYSFIDKLPKTEEYNLKQQLRRAAVSVCSNIAEISGRKSALERKRFYEVARSSVIEIDSQLEVSIAIPYVSEDECTEINKVLMEVFKMLTKMIDG